MNKYTVYRTTESSIELEGKSLKDINSQIQEIDGDDEAWVYDDETFEVIEHGDGERINNSDCGCKECINKQPEYCRECCDCWLATFVGRPCSCAIENE